MHGEQRLPGYDGVPEMTKAEWIEKEVAEQEKKMPLDAHNKSVLRSMKGK
jgi:hypothetical protein